MGSAVAAGDSTVMPHTSVQDDCLCEEDIAAFLLGGLPPKTTHALEAHVARCVSCRRLLSALAQVADVELGRIADSVSPTLPLSSSAGELELALGTRFGRYVVLDWLGTGGMGIVYAAYDSELNRKVALRCSAAANATRPKGRRFAICSCARPRPWRS